MSAPAAKKAEPKPATCERHHCDAGDCPECPYCEDGRFPEGAEVLERWHLDNHDGAFRFCDRGPCKEMGAVYGVRFG